MEKKDLLILVFGILLVLSIVYIIFFTGCKNSILLGPAEKVQEFDKFVLEGGEGSVERYVVCGLYTYRVGENCVAACDEERSELACIDSSTCDADEECYEVVLA